MVSELEKVLGEIDLFVDTIEPVLETLEKEWEGEGFKFEDNILELHTRFQSKNNELVGVLRRASNFWTLFHEETKEVQDGVKYVFKITKPFLADKERNLTDLSQLKGIYTTEDIIVEFYNESFKEIEKIKDVNKSFELVKKLMNGEYDKDMPEKVLELKNTQWRKM